MFKHYLGLRSDLEWLVFCDDLIIASVYIDGILTKLSLEIFPILMKQVCEMTMPTLNKCHIVSPQIRVILQKLVSNKLLGVKLPP